MFQSMISIIVALHRVLALLHLDQRDAPAIHQASIEAPLSHFQAFEQALFS